MKIMKNYESKIWRYPNRLCQILMIKLSFEFADTIGKKKRGEQEPPVYPRSSMRLLFPYHREPEHPFSIAHPLFVEKATRLAGQSLTLWLNKINIGYSFSQIASSGGYHKNRGTLSSFPCPRTLHSESLVLEEVWKGQHGCIFAAVIPNFLRFLT